MKKEAIEELVNGFREIEFRYRGKKYSITYYNDDRKNYISVGAYYGKFIDVGNVAELLKIRIGNYTLEQIFDVLPDSAFDIY